MRLSDLCNKPVRTLDGKRIGRVHEVCSENGQVVELLCGPAGLLAKLTARKQGIRIAWKSVTKINKRGIVVAGPS